MTPEHIKEELSSLFIGILAANKGFMLNTTRRDYGVDCQLSKAYPSIINGKTRYFPDGRYIDIQLKATTEQTIVDEADSIKYDLEVKTYNDLLSRRNNGNAPLILILFILPQDYNNWVDIDTDEIRLRKHAYWYIPPIGANISNNGHRIRIEIPKMNRLGVDCFNEIHQQFYNIPSL